MPNYTKNLSEPWFSLIKLNIKKVEGRLNKGDFALIKKGDIITFENNDFGFLRKFKVVVTSTKRYNSFQEYLEKETLEKCLPGIDDIVNGVNIYYKYYTKEDERLYKIIAIRMRVKK